MDDQLKSEYLISYAIIISQFEDDLFPIPSGYDEYLTKMYGNYMELPKPADRVFHDFEAYILNED